MRRDKLSANLSCQQTLLESTQFTRTIDLIGKVLLRSTNSQKA